MLNVYGHVFLACSVRQFSREQLTFYDRFVRQKHRFKQGIHYAEWNGTTDKAESIVLGTLRTCVLL